MLAPSSVYDKVVASPTYRLLPLLDPPRNGEGDRSRSLLRRSIVVLGVRVTFGQIAALGCVLAIVVLTIGTGILAAGKLGFDAAFDALAGGAVATCGASPAMAPIG